MVQASLFLWLNNRNVTYKLRNFYVTFCFFKNRSLQVEVRLRLVLGILRVLKPRPRQILQSGSVLDRSLSHQRIETSSSLDGISPQRW